MSNVFGYRVTAVEREKDIRYIDVLLAQLEAVSKLTIDPAVFREGDIDPATAIYEDPNLASQMGLTPTDVKDLFWFAELSEPTERGDYSRGREITIELEERYGDWMHPPEEAKIIRAKLKRQRSHHVRKLR